MHELSIASSVVDSVLEFIDTHEVKKVLTVRLAVGELSYVETEQLRFCYSAITQETAMENSTLEIESVAAVVVCPQCDYRGSPKYWEDALSAAPIPTLECPHCHSTVEPVQGHDCAIKTIQFIACADEMPGNRRKQ
ncbi:MAG: hydrogenase maturation nickel metallochaperone HypA [Verrucomicrobia bacterium]|nr:hydrogenase maturation nickel metallochaperone HypA [Verrucomicrobiota bacterium]MBV8377846.1 hydrogenase maturation nickel metallochaperone HypA [Verrucomicrobiota bacterium]